MKTYYKVSFEYSEGIYCTNMAHAENSADVEKHYSKYTWCSVREAAPYELDEAKAKGMPIIEIEHDEPATTATAATTTEDHATEETTQTESKEEEKGMTTLEKIAADMQTYYTNRSAWDRGVATIAADLLGEYSNNYGKNAAAPTMTDLLNGADNWSQYSWGGCYLVYDGDIAELLCTPSELKRTRNGERRPNSSEEWLDVQARALNQAARRIINSARRVCKEV